MALTLGATANTCTSRPRPAVPGCATGDGSAELPPPRISHSTRLEEIALVDPRYRLSVVIATTVGWPRMRLSLDSVVPQLAAVGGQLIVADSSSRPIPGAVTRAVDTIWLKRPKTGVFQLRREAYAQAG